MLTKYGGPSPRISVCSSYYSGRGTSDIINVAPPERIGRQLYPCASKIHPPCRL